MVTAVGNLGFNLLVARAGGAEAYGAVAALLGLSALGGFIATGNQYAVARMTATSDASPAALVGRGLRAVSPWLLVAAALLAVTGPAAAYLHLDTALPVAFGVGLFAAIITGSAISGVLVGRRRFRVIAGLSITTMVVRISLGLLFLPGRDAVTYALGLSLAATVSTSLLAAGMVLRGGRIAAEGPARLGRAATLAAEGLIGSLLAGALWATWSLPVAYARHALPAEAAGDFAATQLIAGGLIIVLAPLTMAFFPTIARYRDRRTISAGLGATLAIGLAGAAALALLGPWMIERLYGPGFVTQPTLALAMGISALAVATASYCVWAARALLSHPRALASGALVAVGLEATIGLAVQESPALLAASPGVAIIVGVVVVAIAMTMANRRGRAPAEAGAREDWV
ncbi:MAG: hypothetical protein QOE92_2167 [Chloroflexota bacterium]|jgi:O-antigen/teichoic acid export membrane protein|nr:hypothetical protein [Chloroflexota bacterium]